MKKLKVEKMSFKENFCGKISMEQIHYFVTRKNVFKCTEDFLANL